MGEAASLGAAALLEEESELAVREKIKATADYLRPEGGDPDSIAYKLASGIGSIAGIAAPAAPVLVLPVRWVLVLELVKRVNVPVQLELLKKSVALLPFAVPPLVPLTYFQ
jgi:hypothetical protein